MPITDDDLALAARLADAAGAAIRPRFRADFGLEIKADESPVTLADREAEAAMRRLIVAERPMDGIIGEEEDERPGSSGRVWVLDPIDGTRSFIAGRPIFGTLIALMEDGWPMLGVIDQPIIGERWIGAVGRPTTFNGAPAATRRCRDVADMLLATTSPALFDDRQLHAFEHVDAAVRSTVLGGDCYSYGCLASGHLDLVVEAGLKLHDFAALVPVVEGAGGRMCDWAGDPLHAGSIGEVVAIGDPARVEEVVELLACRGGWFRAGGAQPVARGFVHRTAASPGGAPDTRIKTMGLFSKDIATLDDLFVHQLQDIYYAENQITKALPKMIEKATDPELKAGFETHLRETEGQIARLERVFEMHGAQKKAVTCPAIDGIIKEANEVAGDIADKKVLDAALIASAQAVEHYEITRYGTLIAWAKQLGRADCAAVLQETLDEERATDQKLTTMAEGKVNAGAELASA